MVAPILKKLSPLLAGFILLTFSQCTLALTQLTASVDKNPAMLNESIMLTVIADDDVERNALDTSALLKDFIVGQTSVSSQTSIVNFKASRSTSWQIVLIARNPGTFIIPALSIDTTSSLPIELEVVEANSHASSAQQDIFITNELSKSEVYVQQLLTLTLKLHFAVELKSGNLTEPQIPGATIEKVGQDKQSDGIINGKRYRIIEQTYAITPEKSGTFALQAPLFSGEIMLPSRRRSNFLSFAETKPVSIVGQNMTLTVLPIPDSYSMANSGQNNSNQHWLPSELLTLHEEWQSSDNKFIVGEPITRTITLTAAGLSKPQLPKISMQAPKGLKVYPDQAELHSNLTKDRLVSQKVQNFALVASQPGTYELPAIKITWFNTVTNRIQQAILEKKTITILANEELENTPYNSPNIKKAQQNGVSSGNVQESVGTESPNSANINTGKHLDSPLNDNQQWIFIALWIFSTLGWVTHVYYLKRKYRPVKATVGQQSHLSEQYYVKLVTACKNNDAQASYDLILPWLNQVFVNQGQPKAASLAQAQAQLANEKFSVAFNDLQTSLYAKQPCNQWQGKAMLLVVQEINKLQHHVKNTTSLSLNP